MKTLFFKKISIVSAIVAIVIITGVLVGCQKEEVIISQDSEYLSLSNPSLEISDFKNWFNSQKIANKFIGKPNWDNAEIKIMQDGNSSMVSIEIYKGKNLSGNDSIRELHVTYVKKGFTGGVKIYSYNDKENACVKYYSLNGQLLEEGAYYAPKQIYSLLQRYTFEGSQVRLKSGNEDPCDGTQMYNNSATPYYLPNGAPNPNAYNCHAYVWGYLSSNDPCYLSTHPYWNNCPNISGSGYSQVTSGSPQVGDRWVSYGNVSGWGYTAVHSAIVKEVKNGYVTKVEAKCGDGAIYIYNPDCNVFGAYKTNDVRYYR